MHVWEVMCNEIGFEVKGTLKVIAASDPYVARADIGGTFANSRCGSKASRSYPFEAILSPTPRWREALPASEGCVRDGGPHMCFANASVERTLRDANSAVFYVGLPVEPSQRVRSVSLSAMRVSSGKL
jgi:hypothetical protein